MKKFIFFLILFCLANFLLSSCCLFKKKSGDTSSFVTDKKVYDLSNGLNSKLAWYKFRNGLSMLFLERHDAPIVSVRTYYHVGSVSEQTGEKGLAHLFEHMLFKGSKETDSFGKIIYELKEGDIDILVREIGGRGLNASTSTDRTDYYVNVPSVSFYKYLEMEAKRMRFLNIDQDMLTREKNAVFTEFTNFLDDPVSAMFTSFSKTAYESHPYKNEVLGTFKDLEAATVAHCTNFYNTHYSPNNATLLIAGDLDEERLLDMVEKLYGDYQPSKNMKVERIDPEPLQTKEKFKLITHNVTSDKILIGYKIPASFEENNTTFNKSNNLTDGYTANDISALEIIGKILAGGQSSLFEKELVNTQLASSYFYYIERKLYPGILYFYIDFNGGIKAEEEKEKVFAMIEAKVEPLLNEAEITRTVNSFLLYLFDSFSDIASFSSLLGEMFVASGKNPVYLTDYITSLKNLKVDELKKVAAKYIKKENRTTIILVKGEPEHRKKTKE